MWKLLLVLVMALLAGPALAEWKMVDVSEDGVAVYKAYVLDHTGAVELQFYCDQEFPGIFDLTVYTGEDFQPKSNYPEDGELAVSIGAEGVATVTAFYHDFDGELLIFTTDFDVEGVGEVAMTMARATGDIGLTYYDRSYDFTADGAKSILKQFLQTCPR